MAIASELQDRVANKPGAGGGGRQLPRLAQRRDPGGRRYRHARSVARIHAVLASGVVDGRRYLSEAGCRRALDLQIAGRDLVLDIPLRFGLGYAVGGGLMPNSNTLYWGGYGGSLAIIDLDARTTFCCVMNRTSGGIADVRRLGLAVVLWEAMAVL